MTSSINNDHSHTAEQEQPFIPDAHFAVQAQQEEIDSLYVELKTLGDRRVYLRAILFQMQAESQHKESLRLSEIDTLRIEIDTLRRQLFATSQDADMPQNVDEGTESESGHAS